MNSRASRADEDRTFYLLDGLRGVAAIAVMVYHAAALIAPVRLPGTRACVKTVIATLDSPLRAR